MDFTLTEDQRSLRDAARRFAQEELPAVARRCEAENAPVPPDMLRRYAEMGFLGINAPEARGGLGLGNLEALIVLEEFAKISSAVAFPVFEASVGPVRIVERFGEGPLTDRIVRACVRGEMLVAISMSEPDAGTALTDLRTTARIDGDEVVLNGAKRWCSGAGHSHGYVVFCLGEARGAGGIGAVFVEKGTPGFTFGAPGLSRRALGGHAFRRGAPAAREPPRRSASPPAERRAFGKPLVDFQAGRFEPRRGGPRHRLSGRDGTSASPTRWCARSAATGCRRRQRPSS